MATAGLAAGEVAGRASESRLGSPPGRRADEPLPVPRAGHRAGEKRPQLAGSSLDERRGEGDRLFSVRVPLPPPRRGDHWDTGEGGEAESGE